MSFQRSGSSFNPFSASVMGGRGEGFTEIKFPLALNSGWYKEWSRAKFRVFEHRKEKTGIFKHEFIVLLLLDGSVCRIERMGDPDARFDALSLRGSVAQDIAQCFKLPKLARLESSKLISRITLPCDFDIMDVLKICRAIQEEEQTCNYTLRVYNCYFFTLAIQVCLTRFIAPWEGEELFEAWSLDFNRAVENLTNTDETLVTSVFPSHHLIPFRICSILHSHKHDTLSLMADVKSKLKSHIAASSTDLQQGMTYRVNDLLWHSMVGSSLNKLIEEKVGEVMSIILVERFSKAPVTSSGSIESVQALKVEILSNLASLVDPRAKLLPHEIQPELNPQVAKTLRQKLVDPPVDSHYSMNYIVEMTYIPPTRQPLAARSTAATSYQPSLQFTIPKALYYLGCLQRLLLWVLYDVQTAWGIAIFALELDKLPCVVVEHELETLATELEELDNLTELHLQASSEKLRALVESQSAVWNEGPWHGICNYISQGISVTLLEHSKEPEHKICICLQEDSEPIAQDISVFQKHVLRRIEIHANKVERFLLGSADKIQDELQETLSRVWEKIRDDTNLAQKTGGLNILCIDGGGVRGLSSLIILQEVMRRVANAKAKKEIRPHEYFDIIAGTGTGGISACMLGRLRMPIDMAIVEYAKLVNTVFKEQKMTGPTMYKGTKLREALTTMIRKATGDEGEMMNDSQGDNSSKTAIFAMARHNMNAGLPVLFRSYTATTNPGPDCTIWEALYATMAHPDLFKGIDIVDSPVSQSFVGGELGCSNPLAHVLAEVQRVYPDHQVASIISIGAGHARTIQVPSPSRWHRTQDVIVMKDMATDSERVAEEMASRFQDTSGVYFRFNVDQGMQNMKARSWEKMGEAMQHTRAYLQRSEPNQKLDQAARASMERKGTVSTLHAAGELPRVPEATKRLMGLKRCPAPTTFYTGRNDENTQVIACITGEKNERRICVVYGLGGVGKTQLVLSVIERTWDEWDHIIYIDASSEESIEKALTEFGLAKMIGETYHDVISWLEASGERWLMVFDNADTASTNTRKYIPARGQSGSVLITTRLPHLANLAVGPGSVCHLSSMNPADGTVLLVKIASSRNQHLSDDDIKAAEQLVQDVGYLAVAIAHAGAYIAHSPGMTIAKYRSLFLSQRRRMLEEYSQLPITAKLDERGDTVYTTWKMCYDQLRPEARELLWLIAYLHYDGIFEGIFRRAAQYMRSKDYPLPLTDLESQAQTHVTRYLSTFLDSDGNWDTIKFAEVMTDLTSFSLIDFDRVNKTYRVHVLVHDWAKTVVPLAPELAVESTATLLSLSIDRETDTESLAFKRRLGPHVTEILTHNPNMASNHAHYLEEVCYCTGNWSQGVKLLQPLVRAFSQGLGAEHPETLTSMSNLASIYSSLGRHNEAEQLNIKVLGARKGVLGEEHPDTLNSMNNLASTYSHLDRHNEAEQLKVKVLDTRKQILGEEHPSTLRSMNNLASTYSDLGRHNEAEQLQVQVLEAQKRVLGEEHPYTLVSMNALASTYSVLGRSHEAAELYHKAISMAKATLGEQHPDTQLFRTNLKNMQN